MKYSLPILFVQVPNYFFIILCVFGSVVSAETHLCRLLSAEGFFGHHWHRHMYCSEQIIRTHDQINSNCYSIYVLCIRIRGICGTPSELYIISRRVFLLSRPLIHFTIIFIPYYRYIYIAFGNGASFFQAWNKIVIKFGLCMKPPAFQNPSFL